LFAFLATDRKKVTIRTLFNKAKKEEPISWLTCYDYPTASFQEQAGIDMILVGDSLGMTMLGYDSTLPVTMDDMIRHTQAVRRGAPTAFLVGDMPYMSYQPSVESAIRNAGRFMAEAKCDAIKLEGGSEITNKVSGIRAAGIPVVGHLGLTPQSVAALGGFRVQGRGAQQAKQIIDDAKAIEEAGAFAILLEMVPDRVCKIITVAKVFGDAGKVILTGLQDYVSEVTDKTFPQRENWFTMKDEEYDDLMKLI